MKYLVIYMSVLLAAGCAPTNSGTHIGSGGAFTGGKWIIHEINGRALTPVSHGDVPPFIDFMMEEKRLSAFAGCNRMSTGFTLTNDTIAIAMLIATKMACPDMTDEYALEQALAPGNYTFRESGEKLMLFSNDKKVLMLKRPPPVK